VTRTHGEYRGAPAAVLPRAAPAPLQRTLEGGGPDAILALQRTAGNQRVARAVSGELRRAVAPALDEPPSGHPVPRAARAG
jgi:hypothetical protein